MKSALKEIALREIGVTLDGRAGLHVYFFIRALTLLKTSGKLAFIMPADICEGVFAQKLWGWITSKYCLEAVVAFAPEATPFPKIDTNPLIFFLSNTPPKPNFTWAYIKERGETNLYDLIISRFTAHDDTISVYHRPVQEALTSGLSKFPT